MPEHRVRVTIAVPTFRRPTELAALLPLLVAQAADLDNKTANDVATATELVIVDNDPDGSARETVQAAAAAAGTVVVRYTHEPHPGIASARNRALDEAAQSRLLAFIDDDERPHAGWLRELIGVWADTGATLVAGRVVAEFEVPPSSWIVAGRFFVRRSFPTGTALNVAAAGNLLVDVGHVRDSSIRFALDLGLSGGEDTLFSRQLTRAGYQIVWCDESVISDLVPASRISRRWVLRRAWSHGNSAAVVRILVASGSGARTARSTTGVIAARITAVGGGAARIAGGVLRTAFGLVTRSETHQARGSRAAYRGAGMIWASFGGVVHEYARNEAAR